MSPIGTEAKKDAKTIGFERFLDGLEGARIGRQGAKCHENSPKSLIFSTFFTFSPKIYEKSITNHGFSLKINKNLQNVINVV